MLVIPKDRLGEHKFACPLHSEAKQLKTWESRAEKCLLQGQARTGRWCSKTPNSLMVWGSFLWQNLGWGLQGVWLPSDRLVVTGWCSKNFMPRLKLGMGGGQGRDLVPAQELKDTVCSPWGGTRTLPKNCTIVSRLLFSCFHSPSLPWLANVWIYPLEFREGQED